LKTNNEFEYLVNSYSYFKRKSSKKRVTIEIMIWKIEHRKEQRAKSKEKIENRK
jgi:hypothetical protein